jgi:ATP phosphoribosyltransferase regulatory subunit
MESKTVALPAGFRDVLFEEARKKRRIEEELARLFEGRGFGEVSPSSIEFLDLYTRGNQNIHDRVLKFLDRDDNLLGLRADFTPAIARIVAGQLPGAELPVKIWYSGSIFRKVEAKQGRFCEFGQIGAELIGLDSLQRDLEIIDLAMEALWRLGFQDAQLHINHAAIFRGMVPDIHLDPKALRLVKAEIGRKNVRGLAAQLEALGVPSDVRAQVNWLAGCVGDADALRGAASVLKSVESRLGVETLMELGVHLDRWRKNIVFDLSEIDEMEYYTGVMFTFFARGLTEELGKGGRYDTLLKEFGKDMPAVGFSFSMDGLVKLV